MRFLFCTAIFAFLLGCESSSERNARIDQERQDAYNKLFPPEQQLADRRASLEEQAKSDETACGRLKAYTALLEEFGSEVDAKKWQAEFAKSENEVVNSIKRIVTACKKICVFDEQYEDNIAVLDRAAEKCPTKRVTKEIEDAKASMTKLFNKLKRPVGVLQHYYENSGYTLQTVALFRNNTSEEIEAFEYVWACLDAYGRDQMEFYMWQQAIDDQRFGPGETITVTRDSFQCRDTVKSYVFPTSFKPVNGKVTEIKWGRKSRH